MFYLGLLRSALATCVLLLENWVASYFFYTDTQPT